MRVHVEFVGEPFDRAAVMHVLRHLAFRMGWTLSERQGERRIVYATTEAPSSFITRPDDIVILSGPHVRKHLETSSCPIPLTDGLPFAQPLKRQAHENWIAADVVAGAYAVMNLWYETRTRPSDKDGWIRWDDDWWAKSSIRQAYNIVDGWLDEIALAAVRLEWISNVPPPRLLDAPFVIVLTHDVDYLPGPLDKGGLRLVRALGRQLLLRRRIGDARDLIRGYAARWRTNPYATLGVIQAAERERDAISSFQFVVTAEHRFDPTYVITQPEIVDAMREMSDNGAEICLHGSYRASRTPGQLEREKQKLEVIMGRPVLGHRQHYLNFSPQQLFCEVERAGFAYDLSVGYNDALGARAGTFFPYRPYVREEKRGCGFWEIPFVLMDTTLATTFRDSAAHALARAQRTFEPIMRAGGCVGIVWHTEQSSGLVDPGYDEVYLELVDWLRGQGGALVNGGALLADLDARWRTTRLDS